MRNTTSNWLEDAARLPVAFSLVREDPLLDREALRLAPKKASVLMVASGGCTAALLAAEDNAHELTLIDPNPSQLALARLKLHLLRTEEPEQRRAVLGHAPMSPDERQDYLSVVIKDPDLLGPPELVAQVGPDFAGRYEFLFARLREVLRPHESGLRGLLGLTDPARQSALAGPDTPLGEAIDASYDDVLALPNLVRLFGEGATQNPAEPFSRHFARRTRVALAAMPAADNPWLWLMLRGHCPPSAPLPWLTLPRDPRPAKVRFEHGLMADHLKSCAEQYHLVHLSNILDWLTPEEATETLARTARALKRGGYVLIRQLNSTLDIRALGPMFRWDEEASADMLRRDRSFFYRAIHLGRKA